MNTPFLSVVIPTYGRPHFLPIAIDSALKCSPNSVEVIVVPNGPDESWRESLVRFSSNTRVRVAPIPTSHANAARNHGMALAQGKYLRFLDDDDFLYPEAAAAQCQLLEESGAEICSGGLDLCGVDGVIFKTIFQPETNDFTESVLRYNRLTATTAHVFLREALGEIRWDESIPLGQDTHWIHSICRQREWSWIKSDLIAGVWRHHAGPRISSAARTAQHFRISGEYLLQTVKILISNNRLTNTRAHAASVGLWYGIHGAYFMDPVYWWIFAKETQRLFPKSHPDIALYKNSLGKRIPPLLLESIMIPKRWFNHSVRQWKIKHGKLASW